MSDMQTPVQTPKIIHQIDGWLIIDKPYGMSSTAVVGQLKRVLHPSKIGHAGTLDPLATGVLPIALGKATRTIEFVMNGLKEYEFEVQWGFESSTDDAEGVFTFVSEKRPTREEIQAVLKEFSGTIWQVPPAYSALKIDGKRAYDLARKGIAVELSARQIQLESLVLLNMESAEKARFKVRCSKGTYVRSLGRDLGQKLGCGAYITALRRTVCEPFDLTQAVVLDCVKDVESVKMIPFEQALRAVPVVIVSASEADRLKKGQRLSVRKLETPFQKEEGIFQAQSAGVVIGLVRFQNGILQPYKMF